MTRRLFPLALAMLAAGAITAGCGASTVSSPPTVVVPVTGVILKATTALVVGGTEQLTAVVAPANATDPRVTWKSSDPAIVTVDGGLITAVAKGSAVVTATAVDGGKTASCVVTVAAPIVRVSGVTLDQTALSLTAGSPGTSATLTATVAPAGASDQSVTWSTSAPSVATVNATAGSTVTVVAHAPGSATITVTTADGARTASCVVTVEPVKVTGVSVKTATSVLVGKSEQLIATVSPSNATNQKVTWATSNPSVATVSASGLVTGVANGTATVTVTADGGKTASCTVTVTTAPVPVTGVTLAPPTLSLTAGSPGTDGTLTATVLPATATNQNVTWASDNTAVATVSATTGGTVTVVGHAPGKANVTVTTEDGAKTAVCAVTVTPVAVTGVTLKTATSVDVGKSEQLTATVSPPNATNPGVTWTSSDLAIATVSTTGLVSGVKAGTATITVTTVDGGKSASCAVTVNTPVVAVTGVTLDQTTLPLTAGGSATLSATVVPSSATNQTVSWKSDAPSVADVSSATGSAVTVVAYKAGTATITATTADGGKIASCVVEVTAATVAVTSVSIDPPSLSTTLNVGDVRTLTAVVQPANATDPAVTWASDSAAVEIVSTTAGGAATVRASAAGTANVTVTTRDGGKTAALAVTVVPATVPVRTIDLDKPTLLLGVLGSATSGTLTAKVGPADASNKAVKWSTTGAAIATVTGTPDGVATVTAVGAGLATITATTEDGGLIAKCDVNVALLHQAITPATATQLRVGKTANAYDTLYADPEAIETTAGGLAFFAQGDGFKSDGGHFMFNNFGAGGAAAVPGNVNLKLRSYVGLPLASIQTSSPSVKVLLTAQPYPNTASMIGIGRHRNVAASWGYVGVVAAKDTSTPSPIVFDGMPPNVQLDVFNAGKDGTYTYLDLIRVEPSSTAAIDNLAPDEVAGLTRITDAANAVTLGWKGPPDTDFDHVECSEGTTVVTGPGKSSTPGTCVFSNLAVGAHTFTVKTVDTHGNVSAGVTTTVTLTATPPLLEVLIPADTASAYLNDDGSSTYSTSGAEMPVHGLVYYAQKNRFKNGDPKDGGIMTNFVGANATQGSTAAIPMYVGIPITAISSKSTVTVTVYAKVYPGKSASLGLAQQTSVANGTVLEVQNLSASTTPSPYVFYNVPADKQLDLFNAAATGSGTYMYIDSIRVE